MPTVHSSVWINAPLERVYEIAQDNASFPDIMPDVKSLTIVERDGHRVVSDWVGLIPNFGLKVRWRQEDLWDDSSHTCAFKQLDGDYDQLEGIWKFQEKDGGTLFETDLEYEYNVPTLGPLLKKVIYNIVVKNLDGVNAAIKKKAEG